MTEKAIYNLQSKEQQIQLSDFFYQSFLKKRFFFTFCMATIDYKKALNIHLLA